ncbi:bacteriocin propeptide, TIGR03798 family [Rivularia sp. PCC 7116]|uniref:Nif11-like leader peptide family natural product precursor n=1 Tax=Rivularia sp. PCC 7116 TaxID=373994 RepID=UPI00029F21E0|nr:Nif11-like leader peptide family natural product precursor [Rivularia sp. PCC 7116]AFY58611.1 bacteriocin propeptide, TIGR03798 family [Rivularia sp. PCC 7116]
MSIEAVNKFLDKVAQESKIQEELAQAMQAENDRQAVVDLGAKHGFEFTGDELMTEIEKRQKAAIESGELNEEELEAVAGGAKATIVPITTVIFPHIPTLPTFPKLPTAKW